MTGTTRILGAVVPLGARFFVCLREEEETARCMYDRDGIVMMMTQQNPNCLHVYC